VEIVNVGVTGLGLLKRPKIPKQKVISKDASLAKRATASVYFPQTAGKVECAIYVREKLNAGNEIKGPAIIEQYDSTTVLNPGWTARADEWGCLVLGVDDA
jgi:N-methylhydantoinase A